MLAARAKVSTTVLRAGPDMSDCETRIGELSEAALAEKWAAEFRLSITRALADQLETTLRPLKPAPLTAVALSAVLARPGVYALFFKGERVYVGKAARSLQDRLTQHLRKLSGRTGLDSAAVQFVCVYVDEDLDAAAPEKLLIKKYRKRDSIPWNTNGFGNKDPGRNRDTSVVKAAHFDATYPIDLEYQCHLRPGVQQIAVALEAAKAQLPYLLRFETSASAREAYRDLSMVVPAEPLTARNLAQHLVAALPAGWQMTALPGYLILYQERRRYGSALGWWRRESGGDVLFTPGPRQFAAGAVDAEAVDSGAGDPTSLFELDA
ncbi:GIY-YIG nuclease family protein [Micromonospora sp. NPDC005367]|uniref:GIY-YIG nuclease family protein n=1 Tax=Micromonospora sp. NPDC005367 TaxID=3155590 RepID=UPI0033BC250F